MKALAGKRKRLTTMAVILYHSGIQRVFKLILLQYGNTAYDPDRNCPKSEPKSVIEIGQKGPDKYCEFFFGYGISKGNIYNFRFSPIPCLFVFVLF